MRSSSTNQLILKTLSQSGALSQSGLHLTAKQIYERIQVNLPAVNPSTVYRALERLADAGQVSVSDMGVGAAVYELVAEEPHHHLVCQNCGKVATVDHETVQNLFDAIAESHDFQVVTNHLILFGTCTECQACSECQERPQE
ncbi:MAG: Fur family transcriptional regulator [Candidatus Promineifilaceae bacterium]|jgi:Fur family ferric uptake transcriptional regulator